MGRTSEIVPSGSGGDVGWIWKGFERYLDLGLLIVRLGFGLGFFWFYGLPKLRGGP